jgi:hypothetical protein
MRDRVGDDAERGTPAAAQRPRGGTPIERAREQGYREGYGQALGDASEMITEAIAMAYGAPGQAQRTEALQHTRALLRGLRARAGR